MRAKYKNVLSVISISLGIVLTVGNLVFMYFQYSTIKQSDDEKDVVFGTYYLYVSSNLFSNRINDTRGLEALAPFNYPILKNSVYYEFMSMMERSRRESIPVTARVMLFVLRNDGYRFADKVRFHVREMNESDVAGINQDKYLYVSNMVSIDKSEVHKKGIDGIYEIPRIRPGEGIIVPLYVVVSGMGTAYGDRFYGRYVSPVNILYENSLHEKANYVPREIVEQPFHISAGMEFGG